MIQHSREEVKVRASSASSSLCQYRERFLKDFQACPIPDNEFMQNLGLFLSRNNLQKILYLNELYQKIINVHGVVIEFGVRWGQNLALFESFRGIYEPYNFNRKIVGFDTFSGFPSVHEKDGTADVITPGAFGVVDGYETYLQKVLDYHEQESPYSHIKKYELVKGDATITLEQYLVENPETIIAMAYFDLDLYEPTKKCLELIRPYLTKGSIIGFDELNLHDFPGETIALKEVFGLDKYPIVRSPLNPFAGHITIT